MELEKIFRGYARSVKQAELEEITFTPALEKRIRERIEKNRKRGSRLLYTALSAAALLTIAFTLSKGMFYSDAPHSGVQPKPAEWSSEKTLNKLEQAVFERLTTALPDLRSFQVDQKNSFGPLVHIFLRKQEREYASYGIDEANGELRYFQLTKAEPAPNRQPADKVAIEQATLFLNRVLPSKSYGLQQVFPAFDPLDFEGTEHIVKGTDVVFKSDSGSFALQGAVTIRVDALGRVVAFSRVDKFEENIMQKLLRQATELNDYFLQSKTPVQGGYNIVLRKNQREYAEVGIQAGVDGKAVLGQLQLKYTNPQDSNAASIDEVKENASSFLQVFLGKEFDDYQLDTTDMHSARQQGTYLSFRRVVNGIPVEEDTLSLAADRAGGITSFTRITATLPDLAKFPDPAKAVTKAEAENELAANMKLRYLVNPNPLLEYTPDLYAAWYIDAFSGKMKYPSDNRTTIYDQDPQKAITLNPPKTIIAVKTKEEAIALLEKEFHVDLSKLVLHEGVDAERKQKIYYWETQNKTPGKNVDLYADLKTGQIKQISTYRVDTAIKVTKEEAQKEAIRFLERYVDPEIKEVLLVEVVDAGEGNGYTTSGDWEFRFCRSHDGIPVIDGDYRNYIVTVDPSTGKANGFVKNENRRNIDATAADAAITLPSKTNIVSAETATREYLNYFSLELVYKLIRKDGEEAFTPVLAYVRKIKPEFANKQIIINAVTGKAVVK